MIATPVLYRCDAKYAEPRAIRLALNNGNLGTVHQMAALVHSTLKLSHLTRAVRDGHDSIFEILISIKPL